MFHMDSNLWYDQFQVALHQSDITQPFNNLKRVIALLPELPSGNTVI